MIKLKSGTWLHDLVETYNELGGVASYSEVYSLAEKKRKSRGASWTAESKASIRRTIEDHAESSKNFRGNSVFYSVNGHGRGVWALMPEYMSDEIKQQHRGKPAYAEGIEGIARESLYLRKSRNPKLVETRKILDNFTCRVCGFYLEIDKNRYVIDVHHLTAISSMTSPSIISIDDLICLCPNCHRIAHSSSIRPLALEEIRKYVSKIRTS